MADLANIKPSNVLLELKYPGTARNCGVTVELRSLDDDGLKKLKRSITDKRQKLEMKGKNFSAEDLEANSNELILATMVAWTWGKDDDGDDATFRGEKPELNRANVMAVLQELPWVKEQIDSKLGERESFFSR